MVSEMIIGRTLIKKFKQYSKTRIKSNLSGYEVAKMMLSDYGIHNVKVLPIEGILTDHYSSDDKLVNLSYGVYYGRNAAAISIAAHEVGHAIQYETDCPIIKFRSSMISLNSLTSNISVLLIIVGFLIFQYTVIPLVFGLLLFSISTFFSIVTLLTEFDASSKALKWIKNHQITTNNEYIVSKNTLYWALSTYTLSSLSSMSIIFFYMGLFHNRD